MTLLMAELRTLLLFAVSTKLDTLLPAVLLLFSIEGIAVSLLKESDMVRRAQHKHSERQMMLFLVVGGIVNTAIAGWKLFYEEEALCLQKSRMDGVVM
jgi:hypothetical protein